ncbi:protein FAM110A [Chanos chanos]|uniref:Protein FAM110A n=1 Tax=Chanos chanos TaxID=29144 RepID=A0A6J2W9N0_CHACN|nr:protein FAM110A-like [Chanos chanos]
MSVDTLHPSPRRLGKMPGLESSQLPTLSGIRKASAVERLEADKGKYVKSQQIVQTRQQPIIRKPLVAPRNTKMSRPQAPQPTRKVQTRPETQSGMSHLNMEHLSKLITGVSDTLLPSSSTRDKEIKGLGGANQTPLKSPSPTSTLASESSGKSSSSASTPGKSLVFSEAPSGSHAVTVRRVDVRPQVPVKRQPRRVPPQNFLLGPDPSRAVHSHILRLLKPYTQPTSTSPQNNPAGFRPIPVKPPTGFTQPLLPPPKSPTSSTQPLHSHANSPTNPSQPQSIKLPNSPTQLSSSPSQTSPLPSTIPPHLSGEDTHPPPSPAFTRLSSRSSTKRPSLARSKSDVSDRFSHVGVELERFFNFCGLDPADLEELTAPGSDIASISRLRSASAPASERSVEEEEIEEEPVKDGRPSYGISVIERNARVIKWLYGMRQAKDSAKVANI